MKTITIEMEEKDWNYFMDRLNAKEDGQVLRKAFSLMKIALEHEDKGCNVAFLDKGLDVASIIDKLAYED
jgi:hypothetical protein